MIFNTRQVTMYGSTRDVRGTYVLHDCRTFFENRESGETLLDHRSRMLERSCATVDHMCLAPALLTYFATSTSTRSGIDALDVEVSGENIKVDPRVADSLSIPWCWTLKHAHD